MNKHRAVCREEEGQEYLDVLVEAVDRFGLQPMTNVARANGYRGGSGVVNRLEDRAKKDRELAAHLQQFQRKANWSSAKQCPPIPPRVEMSGRKDNFQVQVKAMGSLERFLSDHGRSISGPRTLAQAYIKYRRSLMAGSISSSNQNDTIRQMDPMRVDWATAYKWWKARNDAKNQ